MKPIIKKDKSPQRKRKIKFLTVYQSFNENEKIEFKKFLKSDLNARKRNYDQILSSLKLNAKGVIEITRTKSEITRWNRLSELHLLADKFLILKSLNQNNFTYRFLLLREYDKRNLLAPFEQTYKTIVNEISNQPVFNYDYSLITELDKLHLNHIEATPDTKKFVKKLNEANNFRTGIYLVELLEELVKLSNCSFYKLLDSETLNEKIYASLDFEKILSFFSRTSDTSNKLYFILKFLYLLFSSYIGASDSASYIEAKRIFFKQLRSISIEQRTQFYQYMLGYNIKKMNFSIPGAIEELFFLMDKRLREGILKKPGIKAFDPDEFRHHLIVGLMLKKYEWLDNFIKNYGTLLPLDIKEDYILLARAMISMDRKDFLLCKDLLTKIERRNPLLFVDTSVLKLKALYELKDFDECQNELKKFNDYLRKERIVNKLLVGYVKEFCRAYALLLKFTHNKADSTFNNLQYILSKKTLIGKKWITQKIEKANIKRYKK